MKKNEPSKYAHALVLIIGLGITLLAWNSARHHAEKKLQEEFDTYVQRIHHRIEKRVQDGRLILRATAGLFNVTNTVTRKEFQTYIQSHEIEKNYPGIKSVGVAKLIAVRQQIKLAAQARKEGLIHFRVWPESGLKESAPIWYLEPTSDRTRALLGFDMYSELSRRTAMKKSRDKGQSVITDLIKLTVAGEVGKEKGFLVFAPIYRDGAPIATKEQRHANIIGWVYLTFAVEEVMQGVIDEAGEGLLRNLIIQVYLDDPGKADPQLIYESERDPANASERVAKYLTTRILELPEKSFTVRIQSKPPFESQINDTKSIAVLITGLTVSILLSVLVWLLSSGRERAIQLARRMNVSLIESEKRYRQMFEDNASMAYILDPVSGEFIDANSQAASFWGYTREELRDMNIADINLASFEEVKKGMQEQMEGGYPIQVYFQHRLKDGEVRDLEIYRTLLNHDGHAYLYCIAHDITSRRQTERALHESQARLHAIIETALDAVVQLDEKGTIVDWNSRAEKIFGWKREEVLGRPLLDSIIPEHLHAFYHESMKEFVDGDEGTIRHSQFETEAKRRDGQVFPIEVIMTTMTDSQGKTEHCAFMQDITSRKKSEAALRKARIELENRVFERTAELVRANRRLQAEIAERTEAQQALQESQGMLRQLVAHQDRIRENERKRIAREIHDELGQHLLVLRIDVSMLESIENDHPKFEKRLHEILSHIDTTMRSVRAIINNLRPSVLDLGLYAAMEWQTEEFQRRSGILCDLVARDEDLELDDNVATVLFRILQEALTNVLRHAKATYVKVELRHEVDRLIMTISDNGIGMSEARKSEQHSFGLVGIRERLHILGGHLNVESSGAGTTLTVTVPLAP